MPPAALSQEQDVREAYAAHAGELYGFAVRSLGDSGLAEEAVSEEEPALALRPGLERCRGSGRGGRAGDLRPRRRWRWRAAAARRRLPLAAGRHADRRLPAGSFRYRWDEDSHAVLSSALDLANTRAIGIRVGGQTFVSTVDASGA